MFGNKTENSVKKFQSEHKNWDGEPLKVDGLVGPDESDALNREMVNICDRRYRTPLNLVKGMRIIRRCLNISMKAYRLRQGKRKSARCS
jgi:hypothetical protein